MEHPHSELRRSKFERNPLSLRVAQAALATTLAVAAVPQAYALHFEKDNGITVDLDTTLSYNAQWREAKQDPNILAFGGLGSLTDDGDRNFNKGDMTQNRVGFSSDLDINYGAGGFFARARGWYDDVYDDSSLYAGKPYQKDGLDRHKSTIELQDSFWYHNFNLGEKSLSLRVGNQVVNWGESLFLQGGISTAMGPLDATQANTPGVALKDIFMPIGQVYGELSINDALSLGAYYQYDWKPTRIDAPGSYFSILDGLGQKSVGDPFGPLGTPVAENRPDKGQYGVALRYLAENLNSTEFGFYYLNYNDFAPALQFFSAPSPTGLTHDYFQNIDLYGLSFGTVFGDMNVSGEVSYRDGQPVSVAYGGPGFLYVPAQTMQAQVSGIYIFPQNPLADTLTFTGEIGYNRVLDVDYPGGVNSLTKDRSAAGAVLSLKADYLNLTGGLDMSVTGTYRNDFSGRSSVDYTFTEGVEQLALKTDFTYLSKHKFGVSYVWYLTDPQQIINDEGSLAFAHLNADRDYLALYYRYSF